MKNNIKYTLSVILLLTILIPSSCSNKHEEGEEHGHSEEESNHTSHEEGEEESIHLTAEQINTIGLELGNFSTLKVNDFIKSTGLIGLPPNAYSSVSVKAEGIIEGTKKLKDWVESN